MADARAPTSLAARLRSETRADHLRVERRLLTGGWLDDPVRYRMLVGRLYQLHVHLEQAVERFRDAFTGLDLDSRARSRLLLADLASLGSEMGERGDEASLEFASPASVLGALYVVEGSTLGGQVIAELLRRRLGVDASNGAAGFDPYGAETVARWAQFTGYLGSWVENPDDVVTGARDLFEYYEAFVLKAPVAAVSLP